MVTQASRGDVKRRDGVGLAARESEAFLKQEEAKLQHFKKSLDECNVLTEQMTDVLAGFELRFKELEESMMPIHKHTKRITLAQSNIEDTMAEVDKIIAFRELLDDEDHEARISRLDDYIDWVDQVCQGITYFQANSRFKQADKHLKQFKQLCEGAYSNLEERFADDLRDASRALSPREHPFAEDFRAIPDDKVVNLSKIAVTLDNAAAYIHARRDATGVRSAYCATLNRMRSDMLSTSLKASFVERPDGKWDGRDDKITAARPYELGSHPFVFHMKFYLKLLELERELLSGILAATDCSSADQDVLFMRIATDSMDVFFRKAQEVIQQKLGPNKVLVLLDVLASWKACLPGFLAVLPRVNENMPSAAQDDHNILHRISAMENDFQQAARSEMTARREAVQQHPHKDVRPDGGYHALTLSTIKFLRQLLDFAPTLEALYQKGREPLGSVGHFGGSTGSLGHIETSVNPPGLTGANAPSSEAASGGPTAPKPDPTRPQNAMTEVVSKFLDALKSNIQAKSHQYKVPSLVHIFLLNNYHYISKNVRESELLEYAGSGFVAGYQREIVKARTAYQRESWTKALRALNPEEMKTLATTFTNAQRKFIKSKFVSFNDEFERCYNSQKLFSVPDSDLRSQLRNENVELIVVAYQKFIRKIGDREFASNRGKYVKFRFDGLEQMLNRFFDEDA